MNLICLENICKTYGEKILLKDANLNIDSSEKIGIIGVNGTGKSTLLKIVAGIESFDKGNIITSNDLSLSYLSQNTKFDNNATVIEQVFKGNSETMKTLRDYESTLKSIEENPTNTKLQEKLLKLTTKMDTFDIWNLEHEAKIILTKLGINNFNEKVGNLSGGQKKRIALGSALIKPCNLLILDEPTNHIDNETVSWLEEYLNNRKGALLMITHDRYFLDRVTNKTIELHKGNLYTYTGNYSIFLEKKAEREEREKSEESKRKNLFRRELAWIKRGCKARSTKQKARIKRFEDIKNSKKDLSTDKVEISTGSTRLGKKVIEIDSLVKTYKNKIILNNFDFIISPYDRIGIIGSNGIGKSTLLNIIIGKIKADSGEVNIGDTVKIGYFSQENEELDESMRVIEYIKETAEFIKSADDKLISASSMLEQFLFTKEMQWTFISKLSGGERKRLQLLKILMESPNVLILDEPTNDLDIETLTILEDYIENFSGTVISVSHDRYFLDKTCEKLLVFKGNGVIKTHVGNYTEYIDKYNESTKLKSSNNKSDLNKTVQKKKNTGKNTSSLKFSYKEKLEYEKIDEVISQTESEVEKIEEQIAESGSDYLKLEELLEKKKELEENLETLYERWEYLNELAEKINNQKNSK
ncbi:ABC-F family ATP-binding cassette domain-containing protein [Clostridium oceanicum]|uniref:ABC-F family ATP-binding cassette domain-containing protein n=1 Tax=Clostridium oceanicum TaxID=1543 RepID=A0ABN1J903_9CLOT